jgi:ubiquinone/menaquinone biosynthesis C-methylase UbiE
LGESYHPGGLDLSRDVAKRAGVRSDSKVIDIACGIGTTSLMLANEFKAKVLGIDYGVRNIETASERAIRDGGSLRHLPTFRRGDAESIEVADNEFDFAFCECAFCTFPSKQDAGAEFARVLKPGGRLCLTDVVMDHSQASNSLKSFAAWVSCLADARLASDYQQMIEAVGFEVLEVKRHDDAMLKMISEIADRLQALKMLGTLGPEFDYTHAANLINDSKEAVLEGWAGYVSIIAELK